MPLSAEDLGNLYENVIRAVRDSRGRLIDQHTVDVISNTILDALSRSQTFRDAVSYGIHIQDAADRNGRRNFVVGSMEEVSGIVESC